MGARCRGFTLVEVLVALLILSVLSIMAWQGIDGMSRARLGSQAQMESSLRLGTVIAQWEQDLAAIYDTGAVPALSFDGATLRLARTAEGGVQIVAWSLRGALLQRWTGSVTTRVGELQSSWMGSQQLLGNESGQLALLDGVKEMRLQFFRGNSWSNAQSSGDLSPAPGTPATAQREVLPSGVRLVLVLEQGELTRDIVLAPRMP